MKVTIILAVLRFLKNPAVWEELQKFLSLLGVENRVGSSAQEEAALQAIESTCIAHIES